MEGLIVTHLEREQLEIIKCQAKELSDLKIKMDKLQIQKGKISYSFDVELKKNVVLRKDIKALRKQVDTFLPRGM